MNKKLLIFFFCILFIGFGENMLGKEAVRYDTSPIEARSFDEKKLQSYRQNSDFYFDKQPQSNWLRKLIIWLLGKLYENRPENPEPVINITQIALMIAFGILIIFVFYRLFRRGFGALLFAKPAKQLIHFESATENIHELDFDALINEALQKKQYRTAIRLSYLRLLKLMSDKQIIEWKPDKTNSDYINELRDANLRSPFRNITMLFELVWYGDAHLTDNNVEKALADFKDFRQIIEKPK